MAFPRIYRSFADFERDELRKLDSLRTTVDDLLDERFVDEIEPLDGDHKQSQPRSRRRVRREGWLFE
ncbi:hypothetical protein [Haliangium sp.]|uniref:hypothetical protein n=1 Tax=Haliangium sp. TaxID=2663208 RepID=UPI003D0A1A66